jgi:hypothetical protein
VQTGRPGPDDREKVDQWWMPRSVNLPWELDLGFALQGGARPMNIHWSNPRDEEDHLREEILAARTRRAIERAEILAKLPPEQRERRAQELARDDAALRELEERELAKFTERLASRRREQFRRLPREFVLFTMGLLVTGPTEAGISLESFFTQQIVRAGAVTTFSPRAGLEAEIFPNLFRPRIGTYVEPSRFTLEPDWTAFRQHFTAGFDLYLFRWAVFGLVPDGTAWRLTTAVDVSHNYWNYGLSIGIWR